MELNDAGHMVNHWWSELERKFSHVVLDTHIVMPNHFHGILQLTDRPVGADLLVDPDNKGVHAGAPLRKDLDRHIHEPLPVIMQWFKTMTTNAYIHAVKERGWIPFDGQLWQRNYFERVIRDDNELQKIREYIFYNPLKWEIDRDNPINT